MFLDRTVACYPSSIADPKVPTKIIPGSYLHPNLHDNYAQVFVVLPQVWSIGITLCELVTNLGFNGCCLAR